MGLVRPPPIRATTPPMLARFIAGDRAFAKLRSVRKPTSARQAPGGPTPTSEQG